MIILAFRDHPGKKKVDKLPLCFLFFFLRGGGLIFNSSRYTYLKLVYLSRMNLKFLLKLRSKPSIVKAPKAKGGVTKLNTNKTKKLD